jgi:hypothetical protein
VRKVGLQVLVTSIHEGKMFGRGSSRSGSTWRTRSFLRIEPIDPAVHIVVYDLYVVENKLVGTIDQRLRVGIDNVIPAKYGT